MNTASHPAPAAVAIFASGSGSNAQAIIRYFSQSALARIAVIVSNKPTAGVLQIGAAEGIETLVIDRKTFYEGDAYVPELTRRNIQWVVLAGFLWKVPPAMVAAFPRRIVNIHPALLPRFGGHGMYGQYVHQAVVQAGEVESGITIHYVDDHYDNGDIIFQTACPVLPTDGPEAVAARVLTLEHLHYPRVIEELIKTL